MDIELVRQRAEEFIREHAQDVEWLTINEAVGYREWPETVDMTVDEEDQYAREIDEAITSAVLTIGWN